MVEIHVEGAEVVFEVKGWDKLWAVTSRLSVPTSHILGARRNTELEMGWFDGLKLMGTGVPDLFRAGTFFQKGELVFWDVRERENAILVELDHEHYKKLVIEVADPDAVVATLNAVARRPNG